MIGAGRLNQRLQFSKRMDKEDGAGNTKSSWLPQFECAANVTYKLGGEVVLAARLESKQTAIVTVRASTNTKQITHEWRALDMRDGAVFQVKETPRHPADKSGKENRGYLEFLAMSGAAA